jgi:hypothetical protein
LFLYRLKTQSNKTTIHSVTNLVIKINGTFGLLVTKWLV